MPLLLPDNWLTNVLTAGAEKFTASALWAGYKTGRIYDSLVKRFGIPAPKVFENLIEFSGSMVAAGEKISRLPAGSTLPIEEMPINPYLFSDEPAGRRQLWRTRVYLPTADKWYTIDVASPDAVSILEVSAEVDAETMRRIGGSPEQFGGVIDDQLQNLDFEVIFGEARY